MENRVTFNMNINAGSISSLLSVASFKEQPSSAHLQGGSGFLGIPGLVGTPGLKVMLIPEKGTLHCSN